MAESRSPRGVQSGAIAAIFLLITLALPILYVLSLGPVVWLVNRTQSGQEVATVIYAPLIWLHNQGGWIAQMLDWYVHLFDA